MTNSVNGRWVSSKPGSTAFLKFTNDGSVSGSDGANRIATTWSNDDQGAIIDSFVSTQRAAPGMEMWVARVNRVEANGDELNVFDRSDSHLGVLMRADESDDTDEGR